MWFILIHRRFNKWLVVDFFFFIIFIQFGCRLVIDFLDFHSISSYVSMTHDYYTIAVRDLDNENVTTIPII